ncbi:MAG: hypothetical protein AAB874_07655, partial [Patescibacteria group bacterium]
ITPKTPSPLTKESASSTFTSDTAGYSVTLPFVWQKDADNPAAADIFSDKEKNVQVAIQFLPNDPRLLEVSGKADVINDNKKAYENDQKYEINKFNQTVWNGLPVVEVQGAFTEKGEVWDFAEYEIFFGSQIYNIRINTKPGYQKSFDPSRCKCDV